MRRASIKFRMESRMTLPGGGSVASQERHFAPLFRLRYRRNSAKKPPFQYLVIGKPARTFPLSLPAGRETSLRASREMTVTRKIRRNTRRRSSILYQIFTV